MVEKTSTLIGILLIFLSIGYWISRISAPTPSPVIYEIPSPTPPKISSSLKYIFDLRTKAIVLDRSIKLEGLIYTKQKDKSIAVISVNDGPIGYFKVNETIEPGLVLKQIKEDHVVVNYNGNIEKVESLSLSEFLDKK